MTRRLFLTPRAVAPRAVHVQGSKNVFLHLAALPLLGDASYKLEIARTPDITDVHVLSEILNHTGCRTVFQNSVFVTCGSACHASVLPAGLAARVRPTLCYAAALAAMSGTCHTPLPGGDAFTKRPINVHLRLVEAAGGSVRMRHSGQLTLGFASQPQPFTASVSTEHYGPSLGATITALLLAARARGTSHIFHASEEPEVVAIVAALCRAGLEIEPDWQNRHLKIISEGDPLTGTHRIENSPDRIEAGTYLPSGFLRANR